MVGARQEETDHGCRGGCSPPSRREEEPAEEKGGGGLPGQGRSPPEAKERSSRAAGVEASPAPVSRRPRIIRRVFERPLRQDARPGGGGRSPREWPGVSTRRRSVDIVFIGRPGRGEEHGCGLARSD